jgi:hypothetical protein
MPASRESKLDLLLPFRTKAQHDKLEQTPQRPVHKRQNYAPRTTHHYR